VQQTFAPSTPVATGQLSATPHPLSGQDGGAGYDATGRLLCVGQLSCVQKLSCGESADRSSASTAGTQLVSSTSAPSGAPQADPDDEHGPTAHGQVAFGSPTTPTLNSLQRTQQPAGRDVLSLVGRHSFGSLAIIAVAQTISACLGPECSQN